MITKECLYQTEFNSKEELFKKATEYLVENHYVSSEFEEALLVREADFPTGLPTDPPVAIPHTDGTFVKKDTILCILNNKEIEFNEMGGDQEDVVKPTVFFMLVLSEGKTHLNQLQNLIEKIQGGELITRLISSTSQSEFEAVIHDYL